MADENVIDTAIEFLDKVSKTSEFVIKFIKRTTGDIRIMRATLDFRLIPDKDKPKSVDLKKILTFIKNNKILHVYDLDKRGWRSVPLDRVEWLTDNANGVTYRVSIKGVK
ncbi:MAG: hypothetical protein KatS3mg002_0243 [Candidatus Woesearchaeota archaeon]|nr:MAG: hypothetical protein KatS3mg002_0243 [Candidatus Woesearchaeota archaeon]